MNIVLVIYLGLVFLHKLLGYSYFSAAWRSMLFLAAFAVLVGLIVLGYRHIVAAADTEDEQELGDVQSEQISTTNQA